MTDFITEEMVEKAARAAWDRRYGSPTTTKENAK
jgi:hypothetical protein